MRPWRLAHGIEVYWRFVRRLRTALFDALRCHGAAFCLPARRSLALQCAVELDSRLAATRSNDTLSAGRAVAPAQAMTQPSLALLLTQSLALPVITNTMNAAAWLWVWCVNMSSRVVNTAFVEMRDIISNKTWSASICHGFLLTLLFLHVIWFITILRMCYHYVLNGQVRLVRSSLQCVTSCQPASQPVSCSTWLALVCFFNTEDTH